MVHVLSCIFIVVFFFKQKTAYEMRISDWSSDVCSSDLQPDEGKILPIEVGGQDEIVARSLGDVVEAAVGVFLQPPEGREIILEAVVVAIAEQADAELAVVEQKTAEIALERLDRSEEHTSELQSLMRISYAVFCLTQQ